jgi:hypothetical protein
VQGGRALRLARYLPLTHNHISRSTNPPPAVAFSYFETLLRIGDSHKFLEEETRLKSMRNILNDAGFQEHLYEDFAEDTIDLLRETATATDEGASLLQTFNDPNRSMSIITYLKARPQYQFGSFLSVLTCSSCSQVLGSRSTPNSFNPSSTSRYRATAAPTSNLPCVRLSTWA